MKQKYNCETPNRNLHSVHCVDKYAFDISFDVDLTERFVSTLQRTE